MADSRGDESPAASRFVAPGGTGALGRAVVERLLAQGGRVAVPYRGAQGFEALRQALGEPEGLWGEQAELGTVDAAARFFDHAVGWLGGLDGVAIVAGGYAGSTTLEQAPVDEWDRMLGSNLQVTYTCCRAALPHLLERGGSVVTVGSRLVETGGAGAAAYTVSKAAVQTLTRVLALENRDRGVRFNCVAPGIIDTPANREAMPKADRSGWTSPQAIARTIAFLLSPDSSSTTGAVVPVDGRA